MTFPSTRELGQSTTPSFITRPPCFRYTVSVQNVPVWLDINSPLFGVEAVGLERASLAEALDLVHHLVSSVVASAWQTLRVLYRGVVSFMCTLGLVYSSNTLISSS